MGFRSNYFATVWSVENMGKFTKVRLSTSRKNRDTGEYEQDFSGFCSFVTNAHAKASKLRERDRIQLGDVDVTTVYDKERGREFVNYTVFDFEFEADVKSSGSDSRRPAPASKRAPAAPPVDNPVEGETDEEELPF